jgi:hypothetical protein
VKGITRLPSGLFKATIAKDGKKIQLGTFATITEAADARWAVSREMHGEFARQDRQLSDEHHYDRFEQYRGRPTMAQLRDRSNAWRNHQSEIHWIFEVLEFCDAEMRRIDCL